MTLSKLQQAIIKTAVVLICAVTSAKAAVIYTFVGTGLSSNLPSQDLAFQLTVPNFITPQMSGASPLNGTVQFACSQLTSNTNCDPALGPSPQGAIIFSTQSGGGTWNATISFDALNGSGYPFYFATGAFGTPGVYQSEATVDPTSFNPGTLTVSVATPEPGAMSMMLCGVGLLFAIGTRRRWTARHR